MALQSSGAIKLSEIQTEFTGSNPISLSEYYRGAGYVTGNNTTVPTSGAISVSNFYNTTREFAFTISTSYTTTQDLRTLALAAGWDEAAPVVATVDTGVIIRGAAGAGAVTYTNSPPASGSDGSTGLTITGSFPAGVSLINNGTIYGGGGGGGSGGGYAFQSGGNGGAGGDALLVSTPISITNNNVIGGGGGGGAGNNSWVFQIEGVNTGGGGGGGAVYGGGGGPGIYPGNQANPGANGTETTGGAGGSSYADQQNGGAGGNLGQDGVRPYDNSNARYSGGLGGAGGSAVSGNSYVTWVVTGTLYGALV